MANQYTKKLFIGDLQHMMKYVMPEPNTGCWLWNHCISPFGYGIILLDGKQQKAHRLYYKLFKGKIPNKLSVCHSCDNRICVNPDHIWLGTRGDNNRDRTNKGRSAKGEKNGISKLTGDKVIEIRRLYLEGVPRKDIQNRFKICSSNLFYITSRKYWKHI